MKKLINVIHPAELPTRFQLGTAIAIGLLLDRVGAGFWILLPYGIACGFLWLMIFLIRRIENHVRLLSALEEGKPSCDIAKPSKSSTRAPGNSSKH